MIAVYSVAQVLRMVMDRDGVYQVWSGDAMFGEGAVYAVMCSQTSCWTGGEVYKVFRMRVNG